MKYLFLAAIFFCSCTGNEPLKNQSENIKIRVFFQEYWWDFQTSTKNKNDIFLNDHGCVETKQNGNIACNVLHFEYL